jgi:hypothetical protein
VTLTASEPASIRYTTAGGPPTAYTGPFTLATVGTTVVTATAVDPAGNTGPAATATVRVTEVQGGPVVDDFNRPDGALGPTWQGATGPSSYRIAGGRVRPTALGGPTLFRGAGPFGVDQDVGVTLTTVDTGGQLQGVLAKATADSTGISGLVIFWNARTRHAVLGRPDLLRHPRRLCRPVVLAGRRGRGRRPDGGHPLNPRGAGRPVALA